MIQLSRTHTEIALRISKQISNQDLQTILYAVHSFSFLLPVNETVTGAQFAQLIRTYSASTQAQAIADALDHNR